MKDKNEIRKRFIEVYEALRQRGYISGVSDFAEKINDYQPNLSKVINGSRNVSQSMLNNLFREFAVNKDYIYGESNEVFTSNRKLIPFYDDTITVGGINEQDADTRSITAPSEYIDAGDWFKDATAAIRHYGDSMVEYPSGCILALEEVRDRQLILWGRDYVVETRGYRITKRLQRGKNDEYIKAYSTNTETYPDGQLIHEPVDIAWKDITKILLVLGYVVKKGGGTMVYNKK
ncbi:MAG: hypothetical protein LBS69_06030 [Prevotellaceae bacterium]|jgi:hypothetical protein|nr:hypothetical protein [Prevotellaceae bacterium]